MRTRVATTASTDDSDEEEGDDKADVELEESDLFEPEE